MLTADYLLLALAALFSALYAITCMKGFASVCKTKIRLPVLYTTAALLHAFLTVVTVLMFDCCYFIPLILGVNFLLSQFFFAGSAWFRFFCAGVHAYLFSAARIVVRSVMCMVTETPIPVFTLRSADGTIALTMTVLILSYLLACILENIVTVASDRRNGGFGISSRRALVVLTVTITLLLVFSLMEAASDTLYSSLRAFALYHLLICLLLTGTLWLLLKYTTAMDHFTSNNRIAAKEQQERRYDHYSRQAKSSEELRRFRHDYKNQLMGLRVLVDNGEYERADEYLRSLSAKFEGMQANAPVYSDNMLVDAVLQNLAKRCAEAGIDFEAGVIIGSELPVTDPDLCTLFCNIADNAFEAAERVKGERPCYIRFETSRRVKWLTVTAENTYDGVLVTDRDGIVTRKKDAVLHGLGLKSIRAIMDAVPGAELRIEPDAEHKIFRLTLIFPRAGGGDAPLQFTRGKFG